jgi:hypothetical protein
MMVLRGFYAVYCLKYRLIFYKIKNFRSKIEAERKNPSYNMERQISTSPKQPIRFEASLRSLIDSALILYATNSNYTPFKK